MVAALNAYTRQVVNGQRTPANAVQNQPQHRQAAQAPVVQPAYAMPQQVGWHQQYAPRPGFVGPNGQPMQMQAGFQPQQLPPQYAHQGYAPAPGQGQALTPFQARQAHRQDYGRNTAQSQMLQQGAPVQPGFYQQWQQAPAQGYVPNQYQNVPAMQAAYAQGQQNFLPQYAQPTQHFASRQDERTFDGSGQFNPMAYGGERWRGALSQAVPDPRQRIFDKSGQINAYNNKDALTQARHVLNFAVREAINARHHRQASQMTAERRELIAAAVHDTEGFAVLGQELLLPIREIVDYEGIIRKCFRVRALAQGELFRIAKDVRSTAWVIGQDGQGIEARLYGRYVTPSEFKIGSFPTIDIEDIMQMNYDVLDRAQQTARQEIELEEDKRGRALIDTAARTVNAVTAFTTLGVAAFEDVRYQVERHRLVVEKFLINRAELSDIVKTMSSQVDPVTERELILAGYIGSFLNAVIITSAGTQVEEVVPAGTFYALTGPEYLGEMGIRVELFSEPFNMFAQMRFVKGFALGELVGFVLPSPKSCAVGVK